MFKAPNYTQVPNVVIDELMSQLSPAEFKCMILIIRKTFGYHRRISPISLREFEAKTGLSKQGAIKSIKHLELQGLIRVHRTMNSMDSNKYELDAEEICEHSKGVNSVEEGGQHGLPKAVNQVDTLKKERNIKETTTTIHKPKLVKPGPQEGSSSSPSKEKKELMERHGINSKTIERALKHTLSEIETAVHNTAHSTHDNFSAYFFDQLKNGYAKKASVEEVEKAKQKLKDETVEHNYQTSLTAKQAGAPIQVCDTCIRWQTKRRWGSLGFLEKNFVKLLKEIIPIAEPTRKT